MISSLPSDSDPEVLIHMLVGDKPPSQQLTRYVLAMPEELMKPIMAFTARGNEYPFEREDLSEFVEMNERHILHKGLDVLKKMSEAFVGDAAAQKEFAQILAMIDIFRAQIALVLDGKQDKVDVRSETLMWLITFLAAQVEGRYRTYADAVVYLKRPKFRARMGPATLRPMFREFATGAGTPGQEKAEKLFLILEAALVCGDLATLIGGREVLKLTRVESPNASVIRNELLGRCSTAQELGLDNEGRQMLAEVRKSAYRGVDDADF